MSSGLSDFEDSFFGRPSNSYSSVVQSFVCRSSSPPAVTEFVTPSVSTQECCCSTCMPQINFCTCACTYCKPQPQPQPTIWLSPPPSQRSLLVCTLHSIVEDIRLKTI